MKAWRLIFRWSEQIKGLELKVLRHGGGHGEFDFDVFVFSAMWKHVQTRQTQFASCVRPKGVLPVRKHVVDSG